MMLDAWIRDHGESDLQKFEVVAVEEPIVVRFPHLPEFFFTCRPDTVVRVKRSREVYIMETKTSGFSWKMTELGVVNGEQATTYLYAARSKWPDLEIIGVIPDVTYWNKESNDPGKILNMRCDIVERSGRDLQEFALGVSSILVDIAARIQELDRGKIHPVALFPRNTAWCNTFMRHCEYLPICRQYESIKRDAPPPGFVKDPWVEERVMKSIQPKLKGGGQIEKATVSGTAGRKPSRSKRTKPAQVRKG